jgi:hypothetical protein
VLVEGELSHIAQHSGLGLQNGDGDHAELVSMKLTLIESGSKKNYSQHSGWQLTKPTFNASAHS